MSSSLNLFAHKKFIEETRRFFGGRVVEWGFPGGLGVKNLPAMQETQVQSLGWKEPLEEGMSTHSSILAWRIPWTEEPGGPQSMEAAQSQTRLK